MAGIDRQEISKKIRGRKDNKRSSDQETFPNGLDGGPAYGLSALPLHLTSAHLIFFNPQLKAAIAEFYKY